MYTPELAAAMVAAGLDAFGENGETHTLARVWEAGAYTRSLLSST